MNSLKHIAIIPDGNRRWAKENNLPALFGHERGYERTRELLTYAREAGIEYITMWAFSTENWKRKQEEVDGIMGLLTKGLLKIHEDAKKEKTRVVHIGRRDRIHKKLLELIENIEEETKMYEGFCLCIAIDYGGEDEIERAEIRRRESKKIYNNESNERSILNFLDTTIAKVPAPDLIIRTGGETRTSGFMPLQSAYAEWIFETVLFPDFSVDVFQKAIDEYRSRCRRFGA